MKCRKNCNDKIFTLEQLKPKISIFAEMPSLADSFIVTGSKKVKCMECEKVHSLKWM